MFVELSCTETVDLACPCLSFPSSIFSVHFMNARFIQPSEDGLDQAEDIDRPFS